MSDTVFFVIAKLGGVLIRPDSWLVLGLALTVWGLWRARLRLAWRAGLVTFLAALLLAVVPLGEMLLRPLETRYPVRPDLDDIAGIIVLGGGEDAARTALWDQVQLNEGGERFTEALYLARQHPQARVLFTGGSGALRDVAGGGLSGAMVAERFFDEQGLTRAEFERDSRNTAENARASFAMVDPQPGETWVLVTSAFHMPRSMRSFDAAGWPDVVAWPVDFRTRPGQRGLGWNLSGNLARLDTALREHLGGLAYRMAGR